jgi:hypothetical protein
MNVAAFKDRIGVINNTENDPSKFTGGEIE